MTASTTAGRYNPDDPALRYGVPVRHAALSAAASGIRARRRQIPVEQILLLAAVILFPLGLAFIMLGWWGAAHTGRLYAQIDYLISGGMLGLGISVAGGFMYFGYWLSRHLSESRRQNGLTLQSLQRIEDLLDESLASGPARWAAPNGHGVGLSEPTGPGKAEGRGRRRQNPAPRGTQTGRQQNQAAGAATAVEDEPTGEVALPGGSEGSTGPVLVATPRGTLLHRPDCPVVARRSDLRRVPAGTDGFRYCTMCDAAGVAR